MTPSDTFWNKVAPKYATSKISDMKSYEYTLERTRSYLRSDDHVAEIGCGTGSTALLLAPSVARYHGTDISSEMLRIAGQKAGEQGITNVHFEPADAPNALEEGANLDAVLSFNLLHLVTDIPNTLKAAHAALKTGGLLITKTPCLSDASLKYHAMFLAIPLMQMLGKAPFVQKFSVADYDAMIEEAGFDIIETGNHPANPPNRYVVARKYR